MPIKITHKKVSLSPDSGDGSMIQPSDWNAEHEMENVDLINSDTVYTLQADGSGSFTTIFECIAFLNRCMVANDPKVTINLGEGTFNESSTITYTNKYLDKISIVGADPYDYAYTGVSVSGSAGAWVNVFNIAYVDTSKVKVGQYVMIYSTTTAGTTPARLWGCHLITAVSGTSVTVMNRNNHTAGPSGQVGRLKIFPTVIKATANQSLFSITAANAGRYNYFNIPFLKHVILEGSRLTTPYSCGITVSNGAIVNLYDGVAKGYPTVGISGFMDVHMKLCISDSGNVGLGCYGNSYLDAFNGIIITGVRTNTAGYGINCDGYSYCVAGGQSALNGIIMSGQRVNCQAYAYGLIRRYSAQYDDAVTASCSPTANIYNTNLGSYIEAS